MKENDFNKNCSRNITAIGGVGSRPYYKNGERTHMVTFTMRYGDVVDYIKTIRNDVEFGNIDKKFFDYEVEVDCFIEINDDGFDAEYFIGTKDCNNKMYVLKGHFPVVENIYPRCQKGLYFILHHLDYPWLFIFRAFCCIVGGIDTSCPSHETCPHIDRKGE